MKIEVSNGELLDKISILELKMLKITDKEKLDNILTEFNSLNPLCVVLFEQFGSKLQKLYLQLAKVNGKKTTYPALPLRILLSTKKVFFPKLPEICIFL